MWGRHLASIQLMFSIYKSVHLFYILFIQPSTIKHMLHINI